MRRCCLVYVLFLALLPGLNAQQYEDYLYEGDASVFYAETKQINQFFRRFNCEEAPNGERYFSTHPMYRNREMRQKYISELFDLVNPSLEDSLKQSFIQHVTRKRTPLFLDFHAGEWFAELSTTFRYKGREEEAIFFLRLREETIGSKWVFSHVYFRPYYKRSSLPDTSRLYLPSGVRDPMGFMHPMSHELAFMNVRKVFNDRENISQYMDPDEGTTMMKLFLYEVYKSKLRFKTVKKVKFHFFQIDNWYFELAQFRRSGYNRGWLISQLSELPEDKKSMLKRFIYRRE
ncbi:MAG: hypothetical protein AAF824_13575 [Bacteroidota bacterium]